MTTQRLKKKAGRRLSQDQQHRLVELGFVWDPFEAIWEEQFAALAQYKTQHGDCNVPQGWLENLTLGTWVSTQRGEQRKGRLTDEQQRRLEALGFVWDSLEAIWEEQFAALAQYKTQHGDCNVPRHWPEQHGLGSWVTRQRQEKKTGGLSLDRQRRLDALGFVWSRQAPKKKNPPGKNPST